MKQATVQIDEDQARVLRLVSFQEKRPLDDIVRDALNDYLTQRGFPTSSQLVEPRQVIPDEEWRSRFDAALERFRAGIDPDWTAEEIEADIAAALDEVRQERAARRTSRA